MTACPRLYAGRIALAICFDINFAELFHQARRILEGKLSHLEGKLSHLEGKLSHSRSLLPDHQAAALDADIMVWPSMMHT